MCSTHQNPESSIKAWLKIKKVHRVIRFGQRYWMKAYIMLNSTLRTAAKIEFENNFFKLMNNSIFGKTIKNIRNPKDIKLDTSREKYARYVKL